MKRILIMLLIISAFCASFAWAQTTIPINSRATYLRTNGDPLAVNAVPISLQILGIKPGDTITVRVVGDMSYCWPDCVEDFVWLAGGVFSSSSMLLPPSNLNRVPGAQAIRQGSFPACESWTTGVGDLPTDIPQDFGFSSFDSATVKVPLGAQWLFIAVVDSYYGDNADNDGNLAVQIEKALVTVPLSILWRVMPWETDRMTTTGGSELEYTSEGELFYAAGDPQEPGTTTLYRFVMYEHRDSALTELPNYINEGPLAFSWTSASLPGLSPMVEGFNSETSDYALMQPGEQLAGYVSQPLSVFGYKRFYNQDESILALTNGNVKVESNRVFGGIVWRWTWNGTQFLSNRPFWAYGMKGGMTSLIGFEIDGAYRQVNEGGYGPHGSPLVRAQNNGTTQVTRTVPLDSTNGNPDNPLLWRDAILGKDLTLNFNGMGPVAKYTSYASLPSAIPFGAFYAPIVSLQVQFSRFFVYHANSDFLEDVTSIVPDGCIEGVRYGTGFIVGGGIVSDSTGNHALGIYANNSSTGGNSYVELGKYLCSGQDAEDFTTLDIEHDGTIPAGESTYNSYIVTGTLDDVKGKMRQLYVMGAK